MKVRLMEGEANVKQSVFRWTPQSATYGPVLFVSVENIICLALQRCKRFHSLFVPWGLTVGGATSSVHRSISCGLA
jgi:hypothetical protein